MQCLESIQKTSHPPNALRGLQLPQGHHAAPRLVPRYIRAKRRHLARRPPPCLVWSHSIPALACTGKGVHPLPLRARARFAHIQRVLGQFCQDTDLAGDGAGAGHRPAGPCLGSVHDGAAEDAVFCHARFGFVFRNRFLGNFCCKKKCQTLEIDFGINFVSLHTLGCDRNRMP